ncbi:MAG: phytanoyl-CoA dioxygenase family protein [Chloracidobacterium sp.]|uniref:Phytanoyl-CoA dioxygenase family protein n=1 Tax=Chloracidobacterium validum TaxID=2821543 RepID=A0ABX8BDD1_9BACT|nr:phytanoyl-CoA dioxygenase family protein [Chloracidobacterium validum]QUW04699.1 phytanoyl-CoA dioxygenase family protein [Chloracidobacterium validum]
MASHTTLDFDPTTLPWIDQPDADVEGYLATLSAAEQAQVGDALRSWRDLGYALFPQAVDQATIDAYLADIEELYDRRDCGALILGESFGIKPVRELSRDQLDAEHHLRLMDFHNHSIAGKKLALNRVAVTFLRHVFQAEVVAMQSLTFIHGSEQGTHQDFPYVVAQIPSHLAAAWIALEDVHPDAGPLGYFPGSHRIPKFNFGNGLFLTPESPLREDAFQRYLEATCAELGLEQRVFLPRKGDMFMWHAALAHGGLRVNNPRLTRRSFVVHYSSLQAYPRDRRAPDVIPKRWSWNGAYLYENPLLPEEENLFRRGAKC